MEKKKASAFASLLMILLASFALATPIPPASAQHAENHRYLVVGGFAKACSDLPGFPPTVDWKTPFQTRSPYFWPMWGVQNITFSEEWTLAGYGLIVNLTVPHETYIGLQHAWYDVNSVKWYRLNVTMELDGHGWIFLDNTGDVDCYTFNNDTGVYWKSPSPKAGELAAPTGALPSPGTDGVAGTATDGFGDGTADPRGSSILMLPSRMHVEFWTGAAWADLIDAPWPQVFTTGTAYDIVDEPNSEIDGWGSEDEGHAWEFYSGVDSGTPVAYGHPKWNEYVTYACAWSVLNYPSALGDLDVMFQIVEKKVKEDPTQVPGPVIADISCDEVCNIIDIVMAALSFDAEDEGPGPDGTPGTADDKPVADPNYDARGDVKAPRGLVNIIDIVRIALDFDERLEP